MPELLNLVVLIIVAGVLLGIINSLLPMAPAVKSLLNLVVVIVLIIYVLQFFGLIKIILPMITIFRG